MNETYVLRWTELGAPDDYWKECVSDLWEIYETVVVPWCAEHDHQMDTFASKNAWCCDAGMDDPCRLEDKPRHIKLGGSDE